jgi:hypothetical protein
MERKSDRPDGWSLGKEDAWQRRKVSYRIHNYRFVVPSSHMGCESRVVSSRNSTWFEHSQAKVTFPGADEACALAVEESPWGQPAVVLLFPEGRQVRGALALAASHVLVWPAVDVPRTSL